MPAGTSSQKDWRPPCTKAQDPEAYKRVGEIVETIILNGQIPSKKTFREIDPELYDRFKESSIRNTINTWKRKIVATHKEEGINSDTKNKKEEEENTVEAEDLEADEDYCYGYSDLEENEDDEEFFHDCDENFNKNPRTPVSSPPRATGVKFASIPSPILKSSNKPPSTNPPEMQKKQENGNVMTCDIVNIPGNPKRVFMRIVEDEELRRFLKLRICANAGPMKDVIDQFKLEVHPDGHGCNIELPISPCFFFTENEAAIGYQHERDGNVRGPIDHVSAMRRRFDNEDDLYTMVETYTVSFGNLKVKRTLIDPKVRTKNIMCPTFLVYLEVIEEKATRKQKISLDDYGDEDSSNKNYSHPNAFPSHGHASHHPSYASPPFQGGFTSQGGAAAGQSTTPAAATSTPFFSSSSAHQQTFHSPPYNHAPFPANTVPHVPQTMPNPYNPQGNHTNNFATPPAANSTSHPAFSTIGAHGLPPGLMDPSLIVESFKQMYLAAAGAAHQQQPQVGHHHQTVHNSTSAPVPSGTAASVPNASRDSRVPTEVPSSDASHSSTAAGAKFKRGERHIDVSASRDDFGRQRVRERGRPVSDVSVVSDSGVNAAGENYFSPTAHSQISTDAGAGGNGFFTEADGLDV